MVMTEPGKAWNLPKREEIDPKYKWKLEDIYADNDQWERDFNKVKQLSGEIVKFKGTLSHSAKQLFLCLKFAEKLQSLNDKVFV
ncbi:hypothetical protein SMA90_33435, partial [Escherichia coli]